MNTSVCAQILKTIRYWSYIKCYIWALEKVHSFVSWGFGLGGGVVFMFCFILFFTSLLWGKVWIFGLYSDTYFIVIFKNKRVGTEVN